MGAVGAQGTCWIRLLNQAAEQSDVNVLSPGFKVHSRSSRLWQGADTRRRLPHILCLRSGVGLLYLDPLSSLTQIPPYVQVNIRSLAQRRQFSLLFRPPPRNDKLEMLKSWVWVLHLKKNFGESYVQRIIATSRRDISPGLGLSSSMNYILYAQVDLITYKNIDRVPVFKIQIYK